MDQDLASALVISAVGIALLFLALALFYGLLVLLAALFKDRASAGVAGSVRAEPAPESGDALALVAALGVALARAEAEWAPGPNLGPGGEASSGTRAVSTWWALHHQRNIAQRPDSRRTP